MLACVYVRVHNVIGLDTVAGRVPSRNVGVDARINPVVIWDENREIINATAPSKFPSPAVLAERAIERRLAPIVTLTNFTRRRRVASNPRFRD